ncbi:MAG: aminotransferase class III-fold pyridoxal phosphate-dependent enzyme, partial [Acidobacteria bacterium]|nr:aminotransferase class III-fold pyridoxal phosphate-dependent enzyme [Acidobacteriota bacterium]
GEVAQAIGGAGGDVLAVLVEPVLGASAGGFAPPEDYLRSVRRTTAERGVLLIADEVLSGCGRTGRFLASEYAGVEADIVVLGKGLTSGFVPGGAVVARREVVEAVAPDFRHGFTFSHHPVVAAVIREVLRLIRDEGLVRRAASMEGEFGAALEPLSGKREVERWWVRGLLAGIALHPAGAGGVSARQFAAAAWERGLLVYPVGGPEGQGDLVVLAPPLTVSSEEIREIGSRLTAACE